MQWRRYSGTVRFPRAEKKVLVDTLKSFSIPEFFVDCGDYLLIDGIYPDVTTELKNVLNRIEEKAKPRVNIRVGPADIRDVPDWAIEEISGNNSEKVCSKDRELR